MVSNSVGLIGRLTRDPELRRTQSGKSVLSFSIAINRRVGKDADHPEADFIDCVAWERTAEFISKYFTKGMKIGIDGRLQSRRWKDKEGNSRKTVEVIVSDAEFIESKRASEDAQSKSEVEPKSDYTPVDDIEDGEVLPF